MNGNPNRSRSQRFFGGTGFYIALFLCLSVAGVGGYFALFGGQTPAETALVTPAEPAEDTVSAMKPEMPEIKPAPVAPAAPAAAPAEVILKDDDYPTVEPQAPVLIVPPLEGEAVTAFSVDKLQYSETLADWRTHDGVDIAAPEGTHVLAACSGTVLTVAEDDLMGVTVVISHAGGCETTYANLQADPAAKPGEYVSAGQVIGNVGTTSLAESAEGAHLHFSVTQNGQAVDPAVFLQK